MASKGKSKVSTMGNSLTMSGSKTRQTMGGNSVSNKAGLVPSVTFNGKIVTPVSLHTKPRISKPEAGSSEEKANSDVNQEQKLGNTESASNIVDDLEKKVSAMGLGLGKKDSMDTSKANRASMIGKQGLGIGHQKKVQELVVMIYQETETQTTFSLPSYIVSTDAHTEMSVVEERTARYEQVKESRQNPDGFAEAFSQTLNNTKKDQNDAAIPAPLQENGCQVTSYEIDDVLESNRKAEEDQLVGVPGEGGEEDPAGLTSTVRDMVTQVVNVAKASPGCLLDPTDLNRPPGPGEREGKSKKRRDPNASRATMTSMAGDSLVGGPSGFVSGGNGNSKDTSTQGANTKDMGTSTAPEENANKGQEADGDTILLRKQAEKVLQSDELLKSLSMVERAVQQNAYHRKHLDYRDLPDIKPLPILTKAGERGNQANAGAGGLGGFGAGKFGLGGVSSTPGLPGMDATALGTLSTDSLDTTYEDDEDAPKPQVKKLFTYFNSDLVRGRSVTSLVWNKANQDILAVGYGKLDTFVDNNKLGEPVDEETQGGLVLFWSLRNPEYPEKVLRTASPVTALEFSKKSPMMLAVGLYSGDVCVYDVQRGGADWSIPLQASTGMPMGEGHIDAVWQVKWIPRGSEQLETLVSISSDGRVLQWNISKGLTVSTLMKLARGGDADGWISRQSSGLCFDFCPDDASTYIVGTEEGTVHKCSVSYSEQYLETYTPHYGPVYKVKCSPHWSEIFLTCSADWSMGLYHLNQKDKPIFQMRASQNANFAVSDVSWCPDNSTVFAAVTQHGMLQIWDLSVSCLDPVVAYDTTQDDVTIKAAKKAAKKARQEEERVAQQNQLNGLPPVPFNIRSSQNEQKEEPKETRIQRLVRNLANDKEIEDIPQHRTLTSVQFSESAPAVVVGDSNGTVTVYRVMEPVVVSGLGPLQQIEKMKSAVLG